MKSTHTPTPWLVRFDEDRFDSKLSVLEVIKPHIINKEELIAPEGDKASGEFCPDAME